MKPKGKNVVWSIGMDKCLIEALVIQAKNGNKFDNCFNEHAYTAACVAVNTRFNLSLHNQKIINRLKTIKKRYKIIRDMLCGDDFRWNPDTKMIECDSDDVWNQYITVHPSAKGIRGKPIEMYDEIKIICGNYQVPSRGARMAGNPNDTQTMDGNFFEDSASYISPSSEGQSETDGTESYNRQTQYDQMPDGGQVPPLAQSLSQIPKQKHSSGTFQGHGFDTLQDAMLEIATSVRRLADAVDQSKNPIDAPELLQAVMEIDDLEEARQMYAFEYFNADPIKARAFMTYG